MIAISNCLVLTDALIIINAESLYILIIQALKINNNLF